MGEALHTYHRTSMEGRGIHAITTTNDEEAFTMMQAVHLKQALRNLAAFSELRRSVSQEFLGPSASCGVLGSSNRIGTLGNMPVANSLALPSRIHCASHNSELLVHRRSGSTCDSGISYALGLHEQHAVVGHDEHQIDHTVR